MNHLAALSMLGVLGTAWGAARAGAERSERPLPPPVDATTWDLASWRAWPFDYEELSVRKASLSVPGRPLDWLRIGDSWVGGGKARKDRRTPGTVDAPERQEIELQVMEFYITGGGNRAGANRIFCAAAIPSGLPGPFPVLFAFHGGGGHAGGFLAVAIARRNPGFAAVAVD